MKKMMATVMAVALALSGCSVTPEAKAAAKTKTRMVVVDRTRVDGWTTSAVLRDTKTNRDYLVVRNFKGGTYVTPLLGPTEEGERQ